MKVSLFFRKIKEKSYIYRLPTEKSNLFKFSFLHPVNFFTWKNRLPLLFSSGKVSFFHLKNRLPLLFKDNHFYRENVKSRIYLSRRERRSNVKMKGDSNASHMLELRSLSSLSFPVLSSGNKKRESNRNCGQSRYGQGREVYSKSPPRNMSTVRTYKSLVPGSSIIP